MPFVVDKGEGSGYTLFGGVSGARGAPWLPPGRRRNLRSHTSTSLEARASAPLGSWLPSGAPAMLRHVVKPSPFHALDDRNAENLRDHENFATFIHHPRSSLLRRPPPPPSPPKPRPPSGSCQSPPGRVPSRPRRRDDPRTARRSQTPEPRYRSAARSRPPRRCAQTHLRQLRDSSREAPPGLPRRAGPRGRPRRR